ncbi:MAG: septum formation initiator family protein [Acidobacteria bacterium]|nr:septum formation initiator family protein [Acidobacteriota bacterium]
MPASPDSQTSARRPPARRSSRGKRIARWAVVFFAGATIVDAVVGERGLLAMLRARDEFEAATAALAQQKATNARLREEIDRLTNDPAAIEELGRGELGLMRPGEKVFIIKDIRPPAAQ